MNRFTRGFTSDLELDARFHEFEDLDYDWNDSSREIFSNGELSSKFENDAAIEVHQHNIPSHLLVVALLEQICKLYDPRQIESRELFQELCSQLSAMKLIPSFAILNEFQSIRDKYQIALDDLMALTMKTIQEQKMINRVQRQLPWQHSFLLPNHRPQSVCSPSRYKDEFEEVEALGKGGFGSVFEVRNKLDGRRYAIKKIKLANIHPDHSLKALREVKVLASLENANVVRYFSAWLEYKISERKQRNVPEKPSGKLKNNSNMSSLPRKENSNRSVGMLKNQLILGTTTTATATATATATDSCVVFDSEGLKDEINFFAISGKFSDFDLSRKSSNKKYESQKDIKYESGNGMKNEKETRFVVKRSNSFAAGEVLYNFDAELNEVKRFAFIEESLRTIEIEMLIQMELCSSTLKHWINDRNEEMSEVGPSIEMSVNMNILKQMLLGVDYIHSKGLIHRDLKPCNVFLSTNYQSGDILVKIGDFGLARSVQNNTTNAAFRERGKIHDLIDEPDGVLVTKGIGTCIYAAPEQILTNSYTSKVDIYSLGIILFELFVPFKTGMERHTLLKRLRNSVLPERIVRKWPEMSSLIREMTNSNPNGRPNTSTLLKFSHFHDKDKMIDLLQMELAERGKQISKLKEMLQEKDFRINELVENQKSTL